MATQLFFQSTAVDFSRGQGDADQQGTTQNWSPLALATTRGAAATSATRTSIAGPVTGLTAGTNLEWISEPLDADTTISGTVTFNLWGNQAANANNTGLGCIVQRLNSQGAIVSTVVDNTEIGIELPNTTPAVRNETASPTSTNMLKGDRLRIRVYFNDAVGVTMGSGGALVFRYAGTTATVNGDSYVTFTENFGFLTTAPSGSVLYLTDTAADVLDLTATSWTFPGTVANLDFGGANWTNITNVQADDGSNATVTGISNGLHCSNFGFAIPTGAIIEGVEVEFEASDSASGSIALRLYDNTAAAIGVLKNQAATSSMAAYSVGSSVDSWSSALTEAIVEDSDFGVDLSSNSAGNKAVDYIKMRLLYTTSFASNGSLYREYDAWTSRGASVQTSTTANVTGPTVPIQATTATPTGQTLEWYTRHLTAFTLSGLISCNIRAAETNAAANAAVRCEIAVCNSDGTGVVVWGASNDGAELGTSEAAMTFLVAGDDVAITDGQCLRIRVLFDDASAVAMGTTGDLQLWYAGTSAAASGDTYITLPQTVTEFTTDPDADVTPTTVAATTTVSADTVNANADAIPATVTAQASVNTPTITADANVTPTTVVATAFIDTPTVDATASPTIPLTEVIGITAIPVPEVVGNANAPPATVAAVATIAAAVTADLDVIPDTVVAAVAIPTSVVSADANLILTTVAAQTFVDTPSVDTSTPVEVTPTTVAASTAVELPSVSANADVIPTTVAVQATVPGSSISLDTNPTTVAVAAITAVSVPTVTGDANLTPTTVAAITTVSTPTVDAIQNPSVTPTTVTAQAFLDSPNITTSGNADITTATVVTITAIDTPSVTGTGNVTSGNVAALTSVGAPTVTADADITPTTVAAVAAIFTPQVVGDANVTTPTVIATAFVEQPNVVAGGSVNVTPVTVVAQVTVDTPTISVVQNPTATPDVVSGSTSVQVPTVTADGNVTAGNVASTTSIDVPTTTADANLTTGNVAGQATVPGSNVTGTADVTTSTVAAVATIPGVSVSATQSPTITLTTVVGTASVETPNVQASGDVQLTLVTVTTGASVPGVSVAADAGPTAGDVGASASVDTPITSGDAEVEAGTQAQAQVPTPGIIILASGDVLVSLETLALSASVPGVSVSILPYEWLGELGTEWTGRTTPEWEQQDGGQEWPVGVGAEWP